MQLDTHTHTNRNTHTHTCIQGDMSAEYFPFLTFESSICLTVSLSVSGPVSLFVFVVLMVALKLTTNQK